eukprot:GDKI01039054.1.p1 GENE.GDKI01039054.1~~GDKI01039054.1.p1  ORF type:complete len:327 (-),score=95.13 GDKI01039054.1:37-1017(-)
MRVLVTGGAGFVGGHLVEVLLHRGDDVLVIDSMNAYYDPSLKHHTLSILQQIKTGSLTFKQIDLTNCAAVQEAFQQFKPEVVCHLAAQAGVRYSIDHAVENVQTNILATVNLLELAVQHKVKNFVLASSSSVYGKSSVAPFSEDQVCDKPISPYAATKRSSELFAHTYHHLHKLNVTCLRFFTVYGPRGRPDMAAYKFIERTFNRQPIDKYGDGSAVREFTYVSDIVSGVVSAIDTVSPFEIVNLGGGATHTLNEFIAAIEKHCGLPVIINQLPDQPGDVPVTSASQVNAQRVLKFNPHVTLDEGIRRTVEWYKSYKGMTDGHTHV